MKYMKCEICNEEINRNHLRKHNITGKEYYDKYLKKQDEDKCIYCNIPVGYISFSKGYRNRCSNCANKEIGKQKEKYYNKFYIDKVCNICGKTFIDDSRKNINNCGSPSCRLYHPTEPKNIEDYISSSKDRCPYCNIKFNRLDGLYFHLSKHFPKNQTPMIYEYIWKNIWKLEIPICKNCGKPCSRESLGTFKNLCDECLSKYKSAQVVKLIYNKEEFGDLHKRIGISNKKTRDIQMSTPEGVSKWKNAQKITGEKNSIKLKAYFKTERGQQQIKDSAKKQSVTMKEKIKNGEFTPNISNRWTHWEAVIKINDKEIRFRSSWEACFYLCNQQLSYETYRIYYIDENNVNSVTIVDFYDEKERILYEIKPRSIYNSQITKMTAIIQHCLDNNIKFIWINETNILSYVDINKFDEFNKEQYHKMMMGVRTENYRYENIKNKKH